MENMVINSQFWQGKRVLVTGHTGFKGGWLSVWLNLLGAKVSGYALEPPTSPGFFTTCNIEGILTSHTIGDIRNALDLQQAIESVQPDVIFHLAAQPLVRYSYQSPVETYATNVMGTVNVLEAARQHKCVKAIVNITTDKCYENKEWVWPYRENEALGGYDPYSSSKACAELVTAAYRDSFMKSQGMALASVRAGNVIGGGDWAADRLIPDFLRSIDAGKAITIRSPNATRPWQHVLEPLAGYLVVAEKLYVNGQEYAEAWNFGPDENDAKPVRWIVDYLCSCVTGASWNCDNSHQLHEANMLRLDSSKAKSKLGWYPRWHLKEALQKTLDWHQAWREGTDMMLYTKKQISDYLNKA